MRFVAATLLAPALLTVSAPAWSQAAALVVALSSDDWSAGDTSGSFQVGDDTYLVLAGEAVVRTPRGVSRCAGSGDAGKGEDDEPGKPGDVGAGTRFRCGGLDVTVTRTGAEQALPQQSEGFERSGAPATLTVRDGERTQTMNGWWVTATRASN